MDMARRFLEIEVDEDGKAIELDVDEDKRRLKKVQTKSKNFKLFQGKKILRKKEFVFKHFGKYPTIHVDFKAEVKCLLEKAGRIEEFNEIKDKYSGYNATLKDGSHIELYNSWAIMNYLKTENFNVYWPASILDKIKQTIGHAKIRPKIAQIMNEVDKQSDADFFIQFLGELGFFRYGHLLSQIHISLRIPNRTVYSIIDEILGSIESINKYYNHSPELIEKVTDSFEDLARLRNEKAVHALTENIIALSGSERTLKSKYELQSVLDAYMLQKFQHVSVKCRTSLHAICDTVLVIADLHVMFIIEYKSDKCYSKDAHQPISDRGYDTLAEEASLKEIFPEDTPIVQNRIYLGIQLGYWSGEMSITYSFNNLKPKTVSKGGLNL
ncbi:hypothetical protein PV326_013538 [Microctonus aethiopoides]|nr:hypothetical protein PV326_013538 [Microctonus aethiopoides]